MKTVVVRRLKDGNVVEDVFRGKDVNWEFAAGVFRVWNSAKTLAVPYQMLESVEITNV